MTAPSATASSAMPSGTRLGEFEITGVVGEGGFGIVYSARDSSLDRIVAIKEYLPSAFANRTS
jgi:serine/threonine protein kinase